MFSPSNSSLTASTDTGGGLRIALVGDEFNNNTNKNAVVFANKNYDESATNHISGVGDNEEANKINYNSLYIASGSSDAVLGEEAISHKGTLGYLGTFEPTKANTEEKVNVRIVVWFEGTDSHVVSAQKLSDVSANLDFKVVKVEARA